MSTTSWITFLQFATVGGLVLSLVSAISLWVIGGRAMREQRDHLVLLQRQVAAKREALESMVSAQTRAASDVAETQEKVADLLKKNNELANRLSEAEAAARTPMPAPATEQKNESEPAPIAARSSLPLEPRRSTLPKAKPPLVSALESPKPAPAPAPSSQRAAEEIKPAATPRIAYNSEEGKPALLTTDQEATDVTRRTLSQEQKQAMIQSLRGEGKRGTIMITAVLGDQEAFDYGRELKAAFLSSGWEVQGVNHSAYDRAFIGLYVSSGTYPPPEDALLVHRALTASKMRILNHVDPAQGKSKVVLIVGSLK